MTGVCREKAPKKSPVGIYGMQDRGPMAANPNTTPERAGLGAHPILGIDLSPQMGYPIALARRWW
jgi:hypothetical protein